MNSRPLLSFAVPVYNFGKFIGQTLESILYGAEILSANDFEIIVLDGCSTDNTQAVVEEYMHCHNNVRYQKTERRGGIDYDLNLAVSTVTGKYVWLFSGDDLLIPGWDRCVFPLLTSSDIVLVPSTLCNIDMIERRPNSIFKGVDKSSAKIFKVQEGDGSLDEYLSRAMSLDALFGFMSSVIVRTNFWHSLPERKDYYGTCWAHCARLIQAFRTGCTVAYFPLFLIRKRGENDSFMENGFINRLSISILGWKRLIEEYFTTDKTKLAVYNLLRRDISISLLLYAKTEANTEEEMAFLTSIIKALYLTESPTLTTRILYLVFKLSPFAKHSRRMIKPLLPSLIKIRHQIRARH
jgi:abequosyltransferase